MDHFLIRYSFCSNENEESYFYIIYSWSNSGNSRRSNLCTEFFFSETFGTDDSAKVGKYFEYLAAKRVKGHWGCPCGSGKRLRDCHMRFVQDLRGKMPRDEALKATRRLESALNRLSKQ